MQRILIILVLIVVLFPACKTLSPESDVVPAVEMPSNFSIQPEYGMSTPDWWTLFKSRELNNLIQHGLNHNYDILSSKASVAQQEARLEKETAGFFPDLNFSAGGQKKHTRVEKENQSATTDGSHSWDASLSGSYTPDIWGEVAAGKNSQYAVLKSAQLDLHETTIEVVAQITQAWVDVIAVREEQHILENQIKINQTLLELQKLRFLNGKANALDVSQQRETLAASASQIPLLEKQEAVLLNSLAFLTGKTSSKHIQISQEKLPLSLPLPSTGIPADLLKNRPDLQAAKMRLVSAHWNTKVAEADLFPSFSLSAQALFSSGKLDLLFQNWVASLAATLAGPIFDGGLRKAEIQRTKAAVDEQVALYAKAVASAIQEVEDALVSIEKQKEYIRLLEEELAVARLTLKDAMIQYQNGQSSYLSYLNTWTNIERLERQLIGEKGTYLKDRIELHTVLGWQKADKDRL